MQRRLVFALLLMTLVSRASSLDTQVEAARRVVGLARDIQSESTRPRFEDRDVCWNLSKGAPGPTEGDVKTVFFHFFR